MTQKDKKMKTRTRQLEDMDRAQLRREIKKLDRNIKEFIKRLKEYKLKCALWGSAWIDDDEIIKEHMERDVSAPIGWKGKIIEFKPQEELDKLAGDKFA